MQADKPQRVEAPSKDPQFKEPAIDAMRAQKDEVDMHATIQPVTMIIKSMHAPTPM